MSILDLSERLSLAQLCNGIGLTIDTIKQLFKGEAITVNGKLHSSEHNRDFNVQRPNYRYLRSGTIPTNSNSQSMAEYSRLIQAEISGSESGSKPHIKSISQQEIGKSRDQEIILFYR